ncbi:MAG TPA: tetratricopeptide repeat protein [Actinomycetota bacterium]|nr:tetratricopeptide repeat protein [Actinomycetota bacterium]
MPPNEKRPQRLDARDPKAHRGQPARRSRPRRVEERPEKPRAELSKAILQELHATARPGKGEILVKVFAEAAAAYMEEDYDEAIRLGEQAKHIALRSSAARELLGLAYYRVGKWNEAAKELTTFRRISGSTEQNPVIADCYRALGKPDKAVEICADIDRKAVDPAVYYEGVIVAAGALADQDRLDDAITLLGRLDLRPEVAAEHHLRAWYALADLLERKGRFTQAREWFEAVAGADADMTDATDRLKKLS